MTVLLPVFVVITQCCSHIFCSLSVLRTTLGLKYATTNTTFLIIQYLSWPSIHHGRRKDGHDGRVWIQDALLQHSGVLLHSPGQRHIIVLGPTTQWVKEQNRPAVASLEETLVGVLHQESMAVVDWVAELEGEYSI